MAREPSIQYAEPVAIAMKSGIAQFDAYGRRFALKLIDNERVLSKLPVERRQQLSAYRMLRGSLDGAPGSWVRLTEFKGGVEGAIWDGQDLYTVTTYERIAPYLTSPIAAAPARLWSTGSPIHATYCRATSASWRDDAVWRKHRTGSSNTRPWCADSKAA